MTRLSEDALAALAADLERTPPEWAAAGAVCVPLSLLASARDIVAELQERRAAEADQRKHPEATPTRFAPHEAWTRMPEVACPECGRRWDCPPLTKSEYVRCTCGATVGLADEDGATWLWRVVK